MSDCIQKSLRLQLKVDVAAEKSFVTLTGPKY
jgi:hypothetical protein